MDRNNWRSLVLGANHWHEGNGDRRKDLIVSRNNEKDTSKTPNRIEMVSLSIVYVCKLDSSGLGGRAAVTGR